MDIIVGTHSIAEALKNPKRKHQEIIATKEGLGNLSKRDGVEVKFFPKLKVTTLLLQEFNNVTENIYKKNDFKYTRIPSQLCLVSESLEELGVTHLYDELMTGPKKILCLDNVTDTNNGAAILRTAAFFGVDFLLTSSSGSFGFGPAFFRISSGAVEHVKIVKCSSLPKVLGKMIDMGVQCIGFSEHVSNDPIPQFQNNSICLVLGAEDKGLSNAIERVLKHKVAFVPKGKITSLNVSVAAALAMERFLGH